MKLRMACAVVGFVSLVLSLAAQTAGSSAVAVEVPPLIQFSNVATDSGGNTLSGVVSITFSLYAAQQGGEPLWTETQNNVQLDSTGHYSVQLGITKPGGVPTALFTSGEARWLGVRIAEQAEQPRVLLLSVPYALKAGDAATIGGLPPSAFVLAAPQAPAYVAEPAATQSVPPPTSSDVTTSGGTVDYLPLWDATSDITSSVVFQSGKKIGIGTATPASTLDINGGNTVRGTLTLPATAKATASAGKNSQALKLQASSFNSTSSAAVNQSFQWQAEAAGNDTASPSGTLNLLYGLGATAPTETGLNIASDGVITFASGQTFPGTGTGDGSVTSVGSGAGLTGGPITSSGTLRIATGGVANTMLAHPSLTVTAGTDLTGGGVTTLGGSTTLSLDTTKVPQLGAPNQFTFPQSISAANPLVAALKVANGFYEAILGTGVTVGVEGSGATGVLGESTSTPGSGGSFTGFTVASGSGLNGTDGVESTGGQGDLSFSADNINLAGGAGVMGIGGVGVNGGAGGSFSGAVGTFEPYGDGIDATNAGGGTMIPTLGFAGNFTGDINVTGAVAAGTKDFKIDHPLDPANKYLFHSSVESSEMMNIYTGNITTDSRGQAIVQLPEWFEVLNTDFRYQLTVIGQFAQAIVGRKIENNRFEIRTSAPNVEVSWQVTGVRQDAYAKAHPLVVEQEKEARLRGFYIHPELYGAPAEKQIEWARHPQMMKKIKEMQARQLAAAQKRAGAQPVAPRE